MRRFSQHTQLEDIIREREQDVTDVELLQTGKLSGRFRTLTKAVPSSATDVLTGDAEGDVITDATYIYTCYSISGTLKWDRRAHSVGW